jgi:hypothetical protein
MNANTVDGSSAETKDVLLAELEIFESAIWRSEETGEKRFNFFITLFTAVAGGLAALWSADNLPELIRDRLHEITTGAGVILLVFGFLTFMRLRHRDEVTAQLKRTTHHVRKRYEALYVGLRDLNVPLPLDPAKTHQPPDTSDDKPSAGKRLTKVLRGGYTISMAVMNGCILTLTLIAASKGDSSAAPFSWGGLLTLVLVFVGSKHFPDKPPPTPSEPAR